MIDRYCHTASIQISRPAEVAMAYLSDGLKHSDWTLGSLERQKTADGLYVGTSLFDHSKIYVRLRTDKENFLITADFGLSKDEMVPLNMLRIVPGSIIGREADMCVVTLMTWRPSGMADSQWDLICVSHETEMFIIKARLEEGQASSEES